MQTDGIDLAIKLLEDGKVSLEALSITDADAILESRVALEDLIADGVANAEALQLYAEIGLAKLGVHIGSPDTSDADIAAYLRRLLERFRREQRTAALARVSPEPIDRWSSPMLRRAQQILGNEALAQAARESYLDALRAGSPAADAIAKRFTNLDDDADTYDAKREGIQVATSGRANAKKLAFLLARVDDGAMDEPLFEEWAREHYLIAMYGRRVRAELAVALAAHVDVDNVSPEDMARGRARDLLIEPKKIDVEDLEIINDALAHRLISKEERDEALRIAMFHQFEQGAAGDRIALEMELALGFDEWSHPALHAARLRGVELELRLLREARKISLEQMEYLEASVVRGLLTREELDRVRTATYVELRFGPTPRIKEAEELKSYSSDSVWLERLPDEKPCWIGDVDLAGKLRSALGSQSRAFAAVANAIIDWLPLYPEASQVRPAFDALIVAFESKNAVSHEALEKLRSLPKAVASVGLGRASPIIDSILSSVRRSSPPPVRRRAISVRRARATSDARIRGSALEGVVRR